MPRPIQGVSPSESNPSEIRPIQTPKLNDVQTYDATPIQIAPDVSVNHEIGTDIDGYQYAAETEPIV